MDSMYLQSVTCIIRFHRTAVLKIKEMNIFVIFEFEDVACDI